MCVNEDGAAGARKSEGAYADGFGYRFGLYQNNCTGARLTVLSTAKLEKANVSWKNDETLDFTV